MSSLVPGSYVTHNKLPDLGSGEILSVDKGTLRVRFASGERSFLTSVVEQHLTVTLAGPVVAALPSAGKGKRKSASKSA